MRLPHCAAAAEPDSHSDACHMFLYEDTYWVKLRTKLSTASPAGQELYLGAVGGVGGIAVKSFRMIGNCQKVFFINNAKGSQASEADCSR